MVDYISSKNLKGIYTKNGYDLKLKNYIFNILLQDFQPDIHNHLTNKLKFSISEIINPWMKTLFMSFLTLRKYVIPVLDSFILERSPIQGWIKIFSIILAILQQVKSTLVCTESSF